MLNFQFLSKCGASPLIITYYITSLFGAITLATELGIVLQQISNPLHLEPPAFRFGAFRCVLRRDIKSRGYLGRLTYSRIFKENNRYGSHVQSQPCTVDMEQQEEGSQTIPALSYFIGNLDQCI